MEWNAADFTASLGESVRALDKDATTTLCGKLIDHLHHSSETYPKKEAERVLQALRNKRFFDLMLPVADALIQAGQTSPKVRRQYAQALLDLNHLTAAMNVLERLVIDSRNDPGEHAEARGLIGRACKQLYVNAAEPGFDRNQQNLARALEAYYEVFNESETQLWHGINTVALLQRAVRDKVELAAHPNAFELSTTMSGKILARINDLDADGNASTWDFATAVEACVALDRSAEAQKWLARYVSAPYTDAFELASTLRQLTEIWELDMESEIGRSVLPVLRAELLKREGGGVELSTADLKSENLEAVKDGRFEKVFGRDSYVTFEWYQMGIDRCRAVACICKETGEGFGTGFLVKGSELHESMGDELLLLTNSHVISDDPTVLGALHPDEAYISFEALGLSRIRVKELIWTSRPHELDATLLRLSESVSGVLPYPIAPRLPLADGQQRIYVVGHPRGGRLSFSLHDNLLLQHQDPRIHYRTPTEGGSSGSPVFNQQWRLVGLHHMGDARMPRLNGEPGSYEANEGIWIGAIKEAIVSELAVRGTKPDG